MKLILVIYPNIIVGLKIYTVINIIRTGTKLGLCHYYIPLREAGK